MTNNKRKASNNNETNAKIMKENNEEYYIKKINELVKLLKNKNKRLSNCKKKLSESNFKNKGLEKEKEESHNEKEAKFENIIIELKNEIKQLKNQMAELINKIKELENKVEQEAQAVSKVIDYNVEEVTKIFFKVWEKESYVDFIKDISNKISGTLDGNGRKIRIDRKYIRRRDLINQLNRRISRQNIYPTSDELVSATNDLFDYYNDEYNNLVSVKDKLKFLNLSDKSVLPSNINKLRIVSYKFYNCYGELAKQIIERLPHD